MAKKVVITGASAGIGRAAAVEFSRDGNELFLVARRESRLNSIAEQCRQAGAKQVAIGVVDLSIPGAGLEVVRLAEEAFGVPDVLVCNAGYGHWGPVEEVPPKDMARMWQVNFQSAYESIHAVLPSYKTARRGHIVLVSSIIGKKGYPYSASYCATKFAQVGLGEALWGELKEFNIGVTVICPGYTATEFQDVATPEKRKRRDRPIRGQDPAAVGRAIVKAVRRGTREVHLTFSGKALLAVNRLSNELACRIMAHVGRREHRD